MHSLLFTFYMPLQGLSSYLKSKKYIKFVLQGINDMEIAYTYTHVCAYIPCNSMKKRD